MTAAEVKKMTLDDLARMPDRTVGTQIAAHFLEMDRWNVTLMARQHILPVDFYFSGNRLKIRKDSILEYFGYKKPD